jgi:hypothetical protein
VSHVALPGIRRERAIRVPLLMLAYPLSLIRSSEGFSGPTGFAPVQLVDEIHLVRTARSAACLQTVKDRIHQSAGNVTSVFRCRAPVKHVIGHMVTIPHGLLDQPLCARLGYVDRWHDATAPACLPATEFRVGAVRASEPSKAVRQKCSNALDTKAKAPKLPASGYSVEGLSRERFRW